MRKKQLILLILLVVILLTGCDSTITMPHSSEYYNSCGLSLEELYDHFISLGFEDIEIESYESYFAEMAGIHVYVAEESEYDFRSFEQDESLSSEYIIIIKEAIYAPRLTIESCPEFADVAFVDKTSPTGTELYKSFLEANIGSYLEFDGVLTDWYDELWFAGSMSFSVAVEDSSYSFFSWRGDYSDLELTGDYHYNKYSVGLISVGTRVHVLLKIIGTESGPKLVLESFDVIE